MATVRVLFDIYSGNQLPDNVTFNPSLTFNSISNVYTIDIAYNKVIMITVTTNDGYYFVRKPNVKVQDASGFSISLTSNSLNSDSTIFTFGFTNGDSSYGDYAEQIEYSDIEVVAKTPTPSGMGAFITYYRANEDILNSLSQVVIYSQQTSSGELEIIDLSTYITSLRSYPFEIDVSSPVSIHLGYVNTNVQAPIANEIFHTIDFGTVTLPSTNNNANDYNVDIKALLPYIGYVNLNAQWYAGQNVNLTYNVDLRTGLCTANFTVNGTIFDIFTGKIGQDLPYKVSAQEAISNWVDTSIQDTYPLEASILTIYHANMSDNILYSTRHHESFLMSVTDMGLCQFDNIHLANTIPSEMQGEIRQLLQSGIIT